MTATSASPHPLADYDLRAVVDWAEVRVTLAGPSQFRHVRDRLLAANPHQGKKPFVLGQDEDGSHTATRFVFRVQDVQGPAKLLAEVQAACRPGDPPLTEEDIEVLGIEVALDAYPRTPKARADLAGAAAHLWRHHARPPAGTTRICHDRHGEIAFQPERIRYALAHGWTVNCGDTDAPHRSRYYLKDYDTRDGDAYAPLPEADHRARAEVTLSGDRVPFTTIAGWRAFRFETLAPLLALRRADTTHSLPPLLALLRDQTRHGRPADPEKQANHRRTHRKDTAADTTANERIRAALRALTRQQRGALTRR